MPLIGKNLMAHLRSNLVVRVPRGAIPGLAGAANELQTAALFVKGRATRPNGDLLGRFHFQISARPTSWSASQPAGFVTPTRTIALASLPLNPYPLLSGMK